MIICRKCNHPAGSVRHDYTNEKVIFIYRHDDGSEHRFLALAIDAKNLIAEDKARASNQDEYLTKQ